MPGGAADALARAAGAAFDRLAPEGAIGIAVSGGSDSTALLALAADWAAGQGRRVIAATVDHALRPESRAEAEAVASLCARLGVGHTVLTVGDLRAAGGNLSAVSRDARYRALAEWARGEGVAGVLLGHTMDDLAETLLMRLARGSGIEGLAAMEAERRHLGVTWLRPLLELRRADLRGYLEGRGIAWCEDPTNEDPAYDRVKARQALAALEPLGVTVDNLSTSAGHLARQRRVLERAMADLASAARRWGAFGEAWLDPAPIRADERDTGLRLLADTLQRISGAPYRPRFEPLSHALDAILAGQGGGLTLSGCLIRPGSDGSAALICREPAACAPPVSLGAGAVLWDHRWHIHAPDAPKGAVVGALGEDGLAEMAAAEFDPLADWAAAPRAVRETTPAIRDAGGTLLAAPLARYSRESPPGCAICVEIVLIRELP